MNIQVDIGTDEQKELIKAEINYVLFDFKNEDFEIVVPADFDEHIRTKINDNRFLSNRTSLNQLVMGKLIGENHLVINPIIYKKGFNEPIRANFYLHEYHHIVNKKRLGFHSDNPKDKKLFSLLVFLFDEYSSNRFAFEKTKELYETDQTYENYYNEISTGHYENLTKSEIYADRFDSLILDFQTRKISIMEFVGEIEPLIERYSVELVSYFSIVDSFEIVPKVVSSVNLNLIERIRESYENKSYLFEKDIECIEKYLTGFGISIETHEHGLYYNVFNRE